MPDSVATVRSVLCVDTDAGASRLIGQLLPGYRAVSACNAFEALREVNAKPFDLYVLDYWLPDLPGVQLCREILKIDPRGPVFVLTNAARDEDRKRALRAGANAYVSKPVDGPRFQREVRIALKLAELDSLRAKIAEERAIGDELNRLAAIARLRSVNAREMAADAMRRTARIKGLKAFVDAGGTLANFERWWPQVYAAKERSIA